MVRFFWKPVREGEEYEQNQGSLVKKCKHFGFRRPRKIEKPLWTWYFEIE